MFQPRRHQIVARGFMLALSLSLLAGCGNETEPEPETSQSTAVSAPATGGQASSASSSTSTSSASSSTSSASSSSSSSAPVVVAPSTPTGLVATAGNAQALLSWTATTGATSYVIKRSTVNGSSHSQVGTATSPSYTDTAVNNGTPYFYVVAAVNTKGTSANSAQVTATPAAPAPVVTVPTPPTGLGVSIANGLVSLTWSGSSGATSYKVKRSSTSGGPYAEFGTPSTTSYGDLSVINGLTYYYVVSALNSAGESANSAQISALPNVFTPPPTTFGTWVNVTPSNVNLNGSFSCGNFGTETVQADPANPSNLYVLFHCQGIWKSTDYGATWSGPINTGTNGATARDCAGGITISRSSTASVPTIYQSCIRGAGTGFWKSADGGVNWTRYAVAPSGSSRQDYYPPVVDPYDQNHLLMAGHEMNYLVESVNGGQTWTNVPVAGGMSQNGGTGAIFFINTGNATTTRGLWLWMAQQAGGSVGTWRTTNSGTAWVQVDKNEHSHGASQIYQPDNNGVVFMAGAYSTRGWGVLRSADYGETWTRVGSNANQTVVVGTSKNLYAMFGYPVGPGGSVNPSFAMASVPGTGTWISPGTPPGLALGAAQIAVVNNGANNILVGAMWNSGVWRYIEP